MKVRMKQHKNQRKTTDERPVSRLPLDFKEALAALLKAKPKRKAQSLWPSREALDWRYQRFTNAT
jgi:hypothetical protein